MSTPEPAAPMIDRRAATPMVIGLVLTVALLAAFAMDQLSWGTIAATVKPVAFGREPDATPLFVFQYIAGTFAVAGWIIGLWGVLGNKAWVRNFAVGALLCGVAVAVFTVVSTGTGGGGYPLLWGLVLLLPCVAGLVAVLQLWRPGSGRRTAVPGLHDQPVGSGQ